MEERESYNNGSLEDILIASRDGGTDGNETRKNSRNTGKPVEIRAYTAALLN